MSGLCNTWMTAFSAQGWLFEGHLRGWWAVGPERPEAEGRGGGASLAFLPTLAEPVLGVGSPPWGEASWGNMDNNGNPYPSECHVPLQ